MSLKDLFNKSKTNKVLKSTNLDDVGRDVESPEYVKEYKIQKNQFIPFIDFDDPANFARYGSAESYYENSLRRIYKSYPYDGSHKEKIKWENESLYLDRYIFNNRYPRTTGYALIGQLWGEPASPIRIGQGSAGGATNTGFYGNPSIKEYITIKGGPHKEVNIYGNRGITKGNIYDPKTGRGANLGLDLVSNLSGTAVEFWLKKDAFGSNSSFTGKEVIFDMSTDMLSSSAGYGRLTIELSGCAAGFNTSPFYVTLQSGSLQPSKHNCSGVYNQVIGTSEASSSISTGVWNHYAFTFASSSVDSSGTPTEFGRIITKLYINGDLNDTVTAGTAIGRITGSCFANIGALRAAPSGNIFHPSGDHLYGDSMEGYGKLLSGSIDEFRFWKTTRTDKDIGRYWLTNVHGGANTDNSKYDKFNPVDLSVYYKFNEGISTDSTIDAVALDCSGRLSHGAWTGYSTTLSRNTGSAFMSASVSSSWETPDPIIYSGHPNIVTLLASLKASGSLHDVQNNSNIYNTFPKWIQEEEDKEGENFYFNENSKWKEEKSTGGLKTLTHIISSYFDTLHLQIEALPKIKEPTYDSSIYSVTGTTSASIKYTPANYGKPLPFSNKLLNSLGIISPELFVDAEVLEQLVNRNENKIYDEKLYNIKNLIYQNIYNNLIYILKSKGTQKSIDNLIRCYGVDNKLIRTNIYADNEVYTFEDKYYSSTVRRNYLNFYNANSLGASVHQTSSHAALVADTDSAGPLGNSFGFISGSMNPANMYHIPLTVEAEVIFPKRLKDNNANFFNTNFQTSSLFGLHSASANTLKVPGTGDDGAFVYDQSAFHVRALRPTGSGIDAKFCLTGNFGGKQIFLTSSVYKNIYDNEKWNFAVRFKHSKYPYSQRVSGGADVKNDETYKVEFYGVNAKLDNIENEFFVTSSKITRAQGEIYASAGKRLYLGAERQHFTGSLINKTDVKFSYLRYWFNYLTDYEIKEHSKDVERYGALNIYEHAFPFHSGAIYTNDLSGTFIPKIDTLALHWNFNQITGTTAVGTFEIKDLTSGSLSASWTDRSGSSGPKEISANSSRYEWFNSLVKRNYIGSGSFFPASNTNIIDQDYAYVAKQQLPELMNSTDMVRILEEDDEVFSRQRDKNAVNYFYAIEKSMYQSISEEMINMFCTVKDFNNLIGAPVNKYRNEYKDLAKLKQLFFEKVQNTPDLEKFIDFYKWIDESVASIIRQFLPASAAASDDLYHSVESHILERNKYQHKFPIIRPVYATQGRITNVRDFNWKFEHAPLTNLESANTKWWKLRAERSNPAITTGDSEVDLKKSILNEVITTKVPFDEFDPFFNLKPTLKPVLMKDNIFYTGSSHFLANLAKPYSMVWSDFSSRLDTNVNNYTNYTKIIHGGTNYSINRNLNFAKINTKRHGPHLGISPKNIMLTFAKDLDIDQSTDVIDPLQKKSLDFKFLIQRESGSIHEELKGHLVAPFNIISSSVTTGYSQTMITDFTGGAEIVNLHSDTYAVGGEEPIQGPFTFEHVGGNQHRHISVNRNDSSKGGSNNIDDATNRPELWRVLIGCLPGAGCGGAIGIAGSDYPLPGALAPSYPHKPYQPASYLRDETAKRSLNIRNIRTTTSSLVLGNYERTYEVIQTSGRFENDRWFIKNEGAGRGSTVSPYITGVVDFAVPDRASTGSKGIFVERFSAPGGPEINSRGFLDLETETFSVYNAMTFRNLAVRQPLRALLSRHCGPLGYDSVNLADSDNIQGSASYHKIQRNTLLRPTSDAGAFVHKDTTVIVTGTVYDNEYITHPIPRMDKQYRWITASFDSGSNSFANSSIFEHARKDGMFSSSIGPVPAINFISGSDFGSYIPDGRAFGINAVNGTDDFIFTDFVGINSNIHEPLTSSLTGNFLGYPLGASMDASEIDRYINAALSPTILNNALILNSLLLHRNGPYEYPSWKQIRTGESPVFRYHRRNNILSLHAPSLSYRITENNKTRIEKSLRSTVTNYTESAISTKYYPIEHVVYNNKKILNLKHTYGNNLCYFANLEINKKLALPKSTTRQMYNRISDQYLRSIREGIANPIQRFISVTYKEAIYPKEVFIGLKQSRARSPYTESSGYGASGYDRRADQRRTFWGPEGARFRSLSSSATPALNAVGFRAEPDDGFFPLGNIWSFDSNGAPPGSSDIQVPVAITSSLKPGAREARGEISPFSLYMGTNEQSGNPYPAEKVYLPMPNIVGIVGNALATADESPYRLSSLGFDETRIPRYYVRPTASLAFVNLPVLQSRYENNKADHPTEYLYPYNVPEMAGKNPWYDSYDDYAADIYYMVKDHTILPEFRISDHMKYYVSQEGGNFRAVLGRNDGFLKIHGNAISASRNLDDTINSEFWKTYCHSDFLKHFGYIRDDHEKINGRTSKISLTCKGIKKILPYNGFYPVTRTTQLAALLSQSMGDFITSTESGGGFPGIHMQSLLSLYFAPGIVYNTIKSGLAVDWPVLTGSFNLGTGFTPFAGGVHGSLASGSNQECYVLTSSANYRVPFESLVDLRNTLPQTSSIFMINPDKYVMADIATPVLNDFVWTGEKYNYFELAMNNFLAEIPNFFLKERGMKTFVSSPESKFKPMLPGTEYSMDIKLYKTDKMYMIKSDHKSNRAYADSMGQTTHTVTRSYDGMYFGPPLMFMHSGNDGDNAATASVKQVDSSYFRAQLYSDPAYAPYTPPYFYGESIARVKFTPDAASLPQKYSLDDIFAGATVEYKNSAQEIGTASNGFPGFRAYVTNPLYPSASEKSMMHLSSSVNMFGKTRNPTLIFDPGGTPLQIRDPDVGAENDQWVISPKFECPVLNFSGVISPNSLTGASGIWATYAQKNWPIGNEGIFISIEESTKELEAYGVPKGANVGSLIDVCGFRPGKQRIGEIADKTTMKEAIVAIPFLENVPSGRSKDMMNIEGFTGKNLFKINKNVYFKQKNNIESNKPAVTAGYLGAEKDIDETSISKLIKSMKDYYFPPFMDFSTYELSDPTKNLKSAFASTSMIEAGIHPFVMYVFEFSTTFDKQDLADMWQGIMAKPMMKAEKQDVTISHNMEKYEFFEGKELEEELRWMVFKVKQKANKSYFDLTADQKDDSRFKFNFAVGEKRPEYNYNWPYDYCSLVELAKIEAAIEIKGDKKPDEEVEAEGFEPLPRETGLMF